MRSDTLKSDSRSKSQVASKASKTTAAAKVAVVGSSRSHRAKKKTTARANKTMNAAAGKRSVKPTNTVIACCVQDELRRYFDLLDGQEPTNLYHMVIRQAEHALIEAVMQECGGNQSKATKWLGISRGNLRNKLADMEYL